MFRVFLRLGCTSFGGPIAHLGYFRAELIERRGWMSERGYADLVGLCQFLPGPASSQAGFALGLTRAGWLGGVAAWAGFTLPSALLLVGLALGAGRLPEAGAWHGLALVAVSVVAQAVYGMARSFCAERVTATLAVVACAAALLVPLAWAQVAVIGLAAGTGLALLRRNRESSDEVTAPAIRPGVGMACLATFAALLVLSVAFPGGLAAAFYRSGALVFGGGHVVLPLLREAVVGPGWVTERAFVAGYGATQAMPGPLFTFAAYLGALVAGWVGAAMALVAIFLPGLLLVAGIWPFWARLRRRSGVVAALRGVNAAVVGLLAAALYDPVWTGAVRDPLDFVLALAGFALLMVWRASPVWVVALGVVAGSLVGKS